jgi:hypothetical protein
VHLSVAAIGQPIQVTALPSDEALEPGIQRSCNGADLAEPDLIEPAVLDQANDATRNSRCRGQITLSQLAPDAHRSQSRAKTLVLHPGSLAERSHLPVLTGQEADPV